jgi:hypothetical protein
MSALNETAIAAERASGYSLQALRTRDRHVEIAAVRQVFCFIAVRDRELGCGETGRFIGRHRTSVHASILAAQRLFDVGDALLTKIYGSVNTELNRLQAESL